MLKILTKSALLFKSSSYSSEGGLKISERTISDFSKKIIGNNSTMNSKKIDPDRVMSFEEYKNERCGSLEDYIKLARSAFPEKTDEMFAKNYKFNCESGYRIYKKACENPGYSPGLMLTSDFFEEEDSK